MSGKEKILGRLASIAVPITISSSVMSLTNLIDLGVVVNRLESIGYSESAAMAVTNSALQALGKVKLPIISMLFGAAVKIAVSYLLTGHPDVGIYGTPIGTFACYLTAAAVNLFYLIKETDTELGVKKMYIKPLLAAIVSCLNAALLYRYLCLDDKYSLVLSICAAVIVYFVATFVLPKNQKIISFMKSVKLFKK